MIILTDKNFEQEVFEYEGKLIVDFWAPWCTPCKQLLPVLEKIEKEIGIKTGKFNIEENPVLAKRFEISGLPTLIIFEDGMITKRIMGAVSENTIKEALE